MPSLVAAGREAGGGRAAGGHCGLGGAPAGASGDRPLRSAVRRVQAAVAGPGPARTTEDARFLPWRSPNTSCHLCMGVLWEAVAESPEPSPPMGTALGHPPPGRPVTAESRAGLAARGECVGHVTAHPGVLWFLLIQQLLTSLPPPGSPRACAQTARKERALLAESRA